MFPWLWLDSKLSDITISYANTLTNIRTMFLDHESNTAVVSVRTTRTPASQLGGILQGVCII